MMGLRSSFFASLTKRERVILGGGLFIGIAVIGVAAAIYQAVSQPARPVPIASAVSNGGASALTSATSPREVDLTPRAWLTGGQPVAAQPQNAPQPLAPSQVQSADLVPVAPDSRVVGSWEAVVSGELNYTHQVEIMFFRDGRYANRLTFWYNSARAWVGGTVGTYKLYRGDTQAQWRAHLTPTGLSDDTPNSSAGTFASMGLPFSGPVWLTLDWEAGMKSIFGDQPAGLIVSHSGGRGSYSLRQKGGL